MAATVTIAATALAGCATGGSSDDNAPQRVDIIARGLAFDAPSRIASGWTTFRFDNPSGMVHFAVVQRLPEGIGVRHHQEQVAPVFQQGMDLLIAGRTDDAMAAFGRLPDWFGDIVFLGGPGMTSNGEVSEVTMQLTPGTYMLECYVKTAGVFHSFNPGDGYGMVHEFTVTASANPGLPPAADLDLTISSADGIVVRGTPRRGEQTVAVHFADQIAHGNFVGHDVHLARLADEAESEVLNHWMDWRRPEGLQTPAPVAFVGGVNEMPAGSTAYLTVDLTPGRYAWVSEVDDPASKNMLRTFVVH